jgi:outer membrane protein
MKTVMKKIILALAIVGFFTVSQVKAQESIFALEYSVGFGTGDVKDFVSTVSWRGISMDYRYFVQPNVGVGFETGYNLFYEEKPYDTYTQGAQSLSGKQYRYLHMVPVLAAADYYFEPDGQFNPFIGLGIGTLYSYRDVDMGMFTMEDDAWQFAIRPEVGTTIYTPGIDFLVALKYNMAFKANDTEAQNYFSLNLGFVF